MAGAMTNVLQPAATTAGKQGVELTPRAVARVRVAMAKEGISPTDGGLRLGILGGGCSGLSYSIRFDTQPRERDRVFTYGDVRVFVDPKSFVYLNGMILDYEETLMRLNRRSPKPRRRRTISPSSICLGGSRSIRLSWNAASTASAANSILISMR